MAKMLKQLVFGQKKNPPDPPRPDYEGDKLPEMSNKPEDSFLDHDYENLQKFKHKTSSKVQFSEKKEPEVVVFENYSEPADLCIALSAHEEDPLYMSPLNDQGCAPPPEEDMYCIPYDTPEDKAPPLPQPCFAKGRYPDGSQDIYDVIPDVNDVEPTEYYDEPWEWTVGTRLTSSLQVSPTLSLDHPSNLEEEEEDMMARQRRLYETAFDSRIRLKDTDNLDDLVQSPLILGTAVTRAASRSSFGSTSGSSASSTPTHLPMDIASRQLTPTERRRVTLMRDSFAPRSMSPQARPKSDLLKGVVNQNYERNISLAGQWDSISRGSGSDRSSSQESMNMELSSRSCGMLGDEGESQVTLNYPNNWKVVTSAKLENTSDSDKNVPNYAFQKEDDPLFPTSTKAPSGEPEVKVLPTDPSCHFVSTKSSMGSNKLLQDLELKENNIEISPIDVTPRRNPSGLLSEVQSTNNVQSPENDCRTSEDYDPPWDLKVGINVSVSVPERLSGGGQSQMTSSVTHNKLFEIVETKDRLNPNKPKGSSTRPNLNLNAGSCKAMRQNNLTLDFGCSALSVIGEKIDPQLTLEKQGWYHGSISRVEAESKLRVLKEGSYLVRNSESSKHDYSLSLKSARGFMHMKIVPSSEGRFILGQFSNPFTSIPEMIQHYSLNKLPIKGAEHMSLLYPVLDQLL